MIRLIAANLRHRRRRMALTVLGIVIGTTLIMTLLFLSQGLRRAVASQLQSFGGDLIFVFPGKEDNPFVGLVGRLELRDKDVNAIRGVSGVRAVLPMQSKTVTVGFDGEEKTALLHGSPWEETRVLFEESRGFGLTAGTWPARDDLPLAVLGSEIAATRFHRPFAVGDVFTLKGRRFEVAGILKSTGFSDDDSFIYVSLERYRRATGDVAGVRGVIVKTEPGLDPEAVAGDIKERLLRQKGIEDFVVLTSDKAMNIVGDVLGVMQAVLGGIAAVALLVGGVGIMNTMFTAVLERTREIGVLMAVGATRRKILAIFLAEAGMLGAVGGAAGAGLASLLAKIAEAVARAKNFPFLTVDLDPLVIAGVLAFTFAVGTLFGAVPAWQASRLRPTEALRYE